MSLRARTRSFNTTSPLSSYEADWAARSSGAILTKRWQVSGDVDPWPDSTASRVVLETSIKRSGAGSIRFNKLASDAAASGLTRILLPATRGDGTETWYQVCVYFPEAALRNKATYTSGEGGQKTLWVSGGGSFSNTNNEVVCNNRDWRGFPSAYYQNGVNFAEFSEARSSPSNSSNATYSNAIDAGAPTTITTDAHYESRYGMIHYSNAVNGQAIPASGDVFAQGYPSPFIIASGYPRYEVNGWTVLMFRIKIGTLGTASSEVDLWAAKAGNPAVKIFAFVGVTLGTENGGHGAVWLSGYDTAKIPNSPGVVDTFCLYTELIVSASTIPFPTVA